ncbi:uncharacterized protein VTP21DRAFT_220 [Calcarisporiella thermophila]|uniref:uncharacterized protein n=1 Tax=Calcarisporiella thermophila TaxID=911321 RepID=UPI0037445F8D
MATLCTSMPLQISNALNLPDTFTAGAAIAKPQSQKPQESHTTASSLPPVEPVVVVGERDRDLTVGRSPRCTIKVGGGNRQVSRVHATIRWNPESQFFDFHIHGVNGAIVDGIPYQMGKTVALVDGSEVDMLGAKMVFRMPRNMCELEKSALDTKEENDEAYEEVEVEEEIVEEEDVAVPIMPSSPYLHPVEEEEEEEVNENEISGIKRVRDTMEADEVEGEKGVRIVEEDEVEIDITEPPAISTSFKAKDEGVGAELNLDAFSFHGVDEDAKLPNNEEQLPEGVDFVGLVIDALVFSRKSSSTVGDIYHQIMTNHPSYADQSTTLWKIQIEKTLNEHDCFGKVERRGKVADNKPKEHFYYYINANDTDLSRKQIYSSLMKGARKCALTDKQYFFKKPPRLPSDTRRRYNYDYSSRSSSPSTQPTTGDRKRTEPKSPWPPKPRPPADVSMEEEHESAISSSTKKLGSISQSSKRQRIRYSSPPTSITEGLRSSSPVPVPVADSPHYQTPKARFLAKRDSNQPPSSPAIVPSLSSPTRDRHHGNISLNNLVFTSDDELPLSDL